MRNTKGKFTFNGKIYNRIDATEDLIFPVQQQDIDSVQKGNPNKCALACAIGRVLGDAFVTRREATILRSIKGVVVAVRYMLSSAAIKAVVQFDTTGVFAPGIYTLKAVPKSSTSAAKKISNAKRKFIPTNRVVRSHVRYMVRASQEAKFAS